MNKVPSPEEPVLEVKGLRKVYQDSAKSIEVLRNISCKVYKGEIVGVVGASGVGKTTLLHILGTLDRPTAGEVKHFGKDVFNYPDQMLSGFRNQEIGFVFQFHHLLPEFTALENVMMPHLISGAARSEALKLAEAMLCELGLEDRLMHRVSLLSGGEQQRVALARAMVKNPRLLLADEPTGNLDEKTGRKVAELLFNVNRRYETTAVIVTHDLSLAKRMDRCLGLMEGKAVELMSDDLHEFGMRERK